MKKGRSAMFYLPDIYMVPCVKCHLSPKEQVNIVVNGLYEVRYETVFVKIQASGKWGTDKSSNCEYLKDYLKALGSRGKKHGIIANAMIWRKLFGSGCTLTDLDTRILWEHHDGKTDFKQYIPFAGYTNATRKEYDGPVSQCNMNIGKLVYYW
eukprot:TRINITY_DN9861_c0_g1_i8.p1 TRINITY_DN9861_c0_g1~~TRINITY_DN9861_c0_g1_i8.p1  ORF type:complete len:153 (+),score=36.73 TRINITY_DN9861_c0_g1_i8:174-632(+)